MVKNLAARPQAQTNLQRRMPAGADILTDGTVHFRVWAPRCQRVAVQISKDGNSRTGDMRSEILDLESEASGWFSIASGRAQAGSLYGFLLDDDQRAYPDPASRYQPQGPHGLSQVIDPNSFEWSDGNWQGVQLVGQVIYEMHLGTFTPEGTFAAAQEQLPELAGIGITLIEIMPVAEFPGQFGWGYDGVNLFAPTRLYGTPDDMRRFVDRAHALGLGVILDVVYNHLGPDGNFLDRFAEDYFTDRYRTDWGAAINFDGPNAEPVREYYLSNAVYWIDEFHLDGLRLDATQDIHDVSEEHILAAITRRIREAAQDRAVVLIGENEPQETRLVQSFDQGGYGLDALWNDDFHHSAMVALTGRTEAYYTDYRGSPQEFISALKYGYLYQGQFYEWQQKYRGTTTRGILPAAFVMFIQNHDQVANSGRGTRCYGDATPGNYRAMTALMLLAPGTPMLFQGQEFAASSPFFFFADHKDALAAKVHEGRAEFMRQFRSLAQPEMHSLLPKPHDPSTFTRCKLDFTERERHKGIYSMHRDLLQMRRDEPVFRAQRPGRLDGAVLEQDAFVLRYFGDEEDGSRDRLLVVNLGRELRLRPAPEPLLARPAGMLWEVMWSSEHPRYGGCGTAPLDTTENWRIPAHAAVVTRPASLDEKTGDRP